MWRCDFLMIHSTSHSNMSLADLFSTFRATDHSFIATLRFLDYARHIRSSDCAPAAIHHRFVPRFDLEQHEHTYELYGELPGFLQENIVIKANDDRNLQISGWAACRPRTSTAAQSTTQEKTEDKDEINEVTATVLTPEQDAADPFVKVQRHDVTKEEYKRVSLDRFREVLNPHHPWEYTHPPNTEEPRSSAEAPPLSIVLVSAPARKPREQKVETACFSDALDPHAEHMHEHENNFSPGTKTPEDNKEKEKNKYKVRYLISERQLGQFHRGFHFPSPIKKDEITARFENGVLHVTAPRANQPSPRKKVDVKLWRDIPAEAYTYMF
jgi:HSP20 family molecular chaperone IbpA